MNRINQLLQDRTKPVLSIYYPAGYPNLNDTTTVLHTLQQKGIDMVEIGIPFSDPMPTVLSFRKLLHRHYETASVCDYFSSK